MKEIQGQETRKSGVHSSLSNLSLQYLPYPSKSGVRMSVPALKDEGNARKRRKRRVQRRHSHPSTGSGAVLLDRNSGVAYRREQ